MSYLVLARKLRPARFQDLIGQESIWKTLLNAIATDRVAHAFLFTGPRGTGKTSSARLLTKALNCLAPVEYEPCNQCENCIEINSGISADVMEIDAASNRGIEHIRELREGVKFSPAKCKYKIYIIDEVHMLTTESFNALLKTLEEPPSHVKFILATTDYHKVPSTVISRCQRFDFTNVASPVLFKYLKKVAADESIELSDASLNLIVQSSSGGVRDALTTLDMLISFGGNQIEDDKVMELLGVNDAREVDSLLAAIVAKDLEQVLTNFQNLVTKGRSLAQLVTDLMKAVKDLSLTASLPMKTLQWREFLPDQLELYQKLAQQVTTGTLQQYFQILLEIESQIKRSSQAQICVEMGLIKLCSVESLAGVAEIISILRSSGKGEKKTFRPVKSLEVVRKVQSQASEKIHRPTPVSTPAPAPAQIPAQIPAQKSYSGVQPVSPPQDTRPSFDYSQMEEPLMPVNPSFESELPPVPDRLSEQEIEGSEVSSQPSAPRALSVQPSQKEKPEKRNVVDGRGNISDNSSGKVQRTGMPAWKDFVDEVAKKSHKFLISLLRTAVVLELNEQRLRLGVTNLHSFTEDKTRFIEKEAQKFFNSPLTLSLESQQEGSDDSIKGQLDAAEEKRIFEIKKAAEDSVKVLEIREIFPGSTIQNITILEDSKDD
ncbi:MAG: DNA polymerase III subunit gamma/tau [SAR324 cluster bacterium]|uniref:DNA polymerase III subunit gamma/tau n=1 Tax=SAR324 cluster bacterium TaxID=2024889 RepID=A0A2A4SUJ0_9DELT|nr:MAG: DNA polymerase III subunit gamma/tau [SAR324 cluster bacterium]